MDHSNVTGDVYQGSTVLRSNSNSFFYYDEYLDKSNDDTVDVIENLNDIIRHCCETVYKTVSLPLS